MSHIPDISTIDGAIDLFTFANLIELFQIIHLSFGDDHIDIVERNAFNFSRYMMRVLVAFFFLKYDIMEENEAIRNPESNVFLRYLVRHVATIHAFLLKAFIYDGADMHYTPALFKQSVITAFQNSPAFWNVWKEDGSWDLLNTKINESYIWEDMEEWKVSKKVGSEPGRWCLYAIIVIVNADVFEKAAEIQSLWVSINGMDGYDMIYENDMRDHCLSLLFGKVIPMSI